MPGYLTPDLLEGRVGCQGYVCLSIYLRLALVVVLERKRAI